jgi:uncharacterized protein (TIGR02594 family)
MANVATPPQQSAWNEKQAIWLPLAGFYVGTAEIAGAHHNPQIQKWLQDCGLPNASDETAWCSAFANGVMKEAGFKGTDRANAKSWLNWGRPLSAFQFGAIYVFHRGDPDAATGHVFFALHEDAKHNVVIGVGGNQGNQVSIEPRALDQVCGRRWPTPKDYRGLRI